MNKNVHLLPSGNYRYEKMINGRRIRETFDHEPTDLELSMLIAEKYNAVTADDGKSFEVCAKEYIKIKENVLSPTTLKNYESIIRNIPEDFRKLKIGNISQVTVQKLVNDYSASHSPKSTKNLNSFVISVLKAFKPSLVIRTTLPAKIETKDYLPTEKDVKKLLELVKDTEYSIPFQLGLLGLRRSEVCALSLFDLDGNILHINKAKVKDRKKQWIIKHTPKTDGSNRDIYLPKSLVKEIRKKGYIYNGSPDTLGNYLNRLQKKNGMPHFKLHALRHYFASFAHANGIPDAYIMKLGGWSSTGIMERVYREAMSDEISKMGNKLAQKII